MENLIGSKILCHWMVVIWNNILPSSLVSQKIQKHQNQNLFMWLNKNKIHERTTAFCTTQMFHLLNFFLYYMFQSFQDLWNPLIKSNNFFQWWKWIFKHIVKLSAAETIWIHLVEAIQHSWWSWYLLWLLVLHPLHFQQLYTMETFRVS